MLKPQKPSDMIFWVPPSLGHISELFVMFIGTTPSFPIQIPQVRY